MTVQPTRDQLRALANAATPGVWEQVSDRRESRVIATGGEHWLWIADCGAKGWPQARKDAEFIAAARNVLPQLLDQLDRAEHRIARLEAQTSIRGRAVVYARERTREAEAERDRNLRNSREAKKRAIRAEARIKAVRDVLAHHAYGGPDQEDAIRRALESGPPPGQ